MSQSPLQRVPPDYRTLPLAGVISSLIPSVDLFLPARGSDRPVLYRARNVPVDTNDLEWLRGRGTELLWVRAGDAAELEEFLASNLPQILADDEHPPQERLKLLNQVVSSSLQRLMPADDPTAAVDASHDLARHLVDLSANTQLSIRDVAKVAQHDFSTFVHSANVANYCTLLLRAMGVTDKLELRELAVAGMLHDMGKLEIPAAILTKPDRLTSDEFAIVKKHPTNGFRKLRGLLSQRQLMVVYQHHERIDGGGYPVGCIGSELHLWSKVCAVVDVYDALTGKRPYRRANTSSEALAIMMRGDGTHFDSEVLRAWQRQLKAPEA